MILVVQLLVVAVVAPHAAGDPSTAAVVVRAEKVVCRGAWELCWRGAPTSCGRWCVRSARTTATAAAAASSYSQPVEVRNKCTAQPIGTVWILRRHMRQ